MEQETQADGGFPLSSEACAALISKIKGGDQSALIILYDKTGRLLFGLISRILRDNALAEETLLDVYTHVWKHAASYDPGFLPLEWLTTIARAHAVARLHWSKHNRKRQEISGGELDPAMTVAPDYQKLARSSVGSLVPVQREILDWAYFSGLSCSEIAAQLGKPLGAVKTHTRLGLCKLSDMFRPIFKREMEA